MNLRILFPALLLAAALPGPLSASKIKGGDSDNLGEMQTVHPVPISYATIDLLAGRPFPAPRGTGSVLMCVEKVTASGKVLITYDDGPVDTDAPGARVIGYVWNQAGIEPVLCPALPWAGSGLPDPEYLRIIATDMDDAGNVVGEAYASGSDPYAYYEENVPVRWPAADLASPQILALGVPSFAERMAFVGDYGSSTTQCNNFRLDDTGAGYASYMSARAGNHADDTYIEWRDEEVLRWPSIDAAPSTIVSNADNTSPSHYTVLVDVSPQGRLLLKGDYPVAYTTYHPESGTRTDTPLLDGIAPSFILDDGSLIYRTPVQNRINVRPYWTFRAPDGEKRLYPGNLILGDGHGSFLAIHPTSSLTVCLWRRDPATGIHSPFLPRLTYNTSFPSPSRSLRGSNWANPSRMTPSGLIGATIIRTHDSAGLPLPSSEQQRPALLVPAGLSVDADRDGDIDAIDPRLNSQTSPFWFAVNDDDDVDAAAEPATAGTDWQNGRVDGKDDLADFFPLFLDIKQLLGVLPHSASGVTYKLKQADGAVNVVFTSLTRETAFGYLDAASATTGYGPDFGQAAASATTQQVTASGLGLPAAFLTRVRDQGQGVVLVEMRGLSSAPLRLVAENADGVEITELALGLSSFRFHADAGKVHLGFDPPDKAESDPANEYWASVVQGATNDILNLDTPPGAVGGLQWRVAPADTDLAGIAMSYVDGTTAKVTLTGHNTGATQPELAKIDLIPFGRSGPAVLTLNVMVLPQREMKLAIYTIEDPDSPLTQFASAPAVAVPSDDDILAVCNDSFKQAGVRFVLHPERGDRARPYRYDTWGLAEFLGVYRYDGLLPVRSPDGLLTENEKSGLIGTHADAPAPALGSILPAATAASDTIRIILFKDSGLPYDSENFSGPKKRAFAGTGWAVLFLRNLDPHGAIAAAHEVGHTLRADSSDPDGAGHDEPPYPSAIVTDLPYNIPPAPPTDTRYLHSSKPSPALMGSGSPSASGLPWPYGRWMKQEDWRRANRVAGGQTP